MADEWWEIWKRGIYADEFLAASETAWDFLKDAPAAILGSDEPKAQGPSWWDQTKVMKFRAESQDLFETLFRAVCVQPLPVYNANLMASDAAIRANYGDLPELFPDWWGPLTPQEYIVRRTDVLGCPIPVMELAIWLGPAESTTTPTQTTEPEPIPPGPPPITEGPPPVPIQSGYVPPATQQKKPMSGVAIVGITLAIAGGGYVLYRLLAPPKKKGRGRSKRRKTLLSW